MSGISSFLQDLALDVCNNCIFGINADLKTLVVSDVAGTIASKAVTAAVRPILEKLVQASSSRSPLAIPALFFAGYAIVVVISVGDAASYGVTGKALSLPQRANLFVLRFLEKTVFALCQKHS